MKKLFLSLMLLLAAGSSVELLGGCSEATQVACGAEADICAQPYAVWHMVSPATAWTACYNQCCG